MATGPLPNKGGAAYPAAISWTTTQNAGLTVPVATLSGYHTGGSNWLMCDGHVKFLNGSKVSSGFPAPNPTTAENDGGTLATETAAGTSNLTNAVCSVTVTFSPT